MPSPSAKFSGQWAGNLVGFSVCSLVSRYHIHDCLPHCVGVGSFLPCAQDVLKMTL